MGIQIVRTVKQKKKVQYTKVVMNLVITLTLLTTLASIYINLVNGCSLDSVVASCWDGLKYIIPSYCCKSFFETREEHRTNSLEGDEEHEFSS